MKIRISNESGEDRSIVDDILRGYDIIFNESIFDQVPFGIGISYNCHPIDKGENKHAVINHMYEVITGRRKDEMVRLGWAKITHPEDLQKNLDLYDELNKGNINNYSMEKRFIRPDGSIVWVNLTVATLKLTNTKYNHLSIVQDITERKVMEKALKESERSKAVLLSNLPGMAYRCNYDKEWTMQFVSEGCYKLTGYKSQSLIENKDLSFNDIISLEYRKLLWNEWAKALKNRQPFKYEYEILTADGKKKWVLEMGQGIYDDGKVIALEGIIIDISERKEQENKLKYINDHNLDTGLYNENYFNKLLAIGSIERKNFKRAILLLNFKKISTVSMIYGYNFSKNIIKEISYKLRRLINLSRVLFQISFERFAIYIKNYDNKNELSDLCFEIFDIIKEIQVLNNIGCCVGIFEIEESNWNSDIIIKNVSIASECTNTNAVYDYCYYDEDLKNKVNRENLIRSELLRIATDEKDDNIYLQYQPILDLRTEKVAGFEALARCSCKELGHVQPLEFIFLAEEMLLIVPIGIKIIRMACNFIKKLEAAAFDNLYVSVNISGIQLLSDNFINDLKMIIEETKISTKNLGIELTESVFMDNFESANARLYDLKQMGIAISIDDFGTGYSSLYRENELNATCLKIDKYFIDNLLKRKPEEVITGDIISMAHRLGHLVVAEGVEHEEQKQYLIDNNCDFIQGYLFSKPLDEEDALKMLLR